MAGIPKRYKDCADPIREREIVEKRWRVVKAYTEVHRLKYEPWIERPQPKLMALEEWLTRYSANQRKVMETTYLATNSIRKGYEFMVKFEKNFYDETTAFEGFAILNPDKHVRGISIPQYEARMLVGPACVYASKMWGLARAGRFFYTAGTTARQRGDWFMKATQMKTPSAAYCGDNMLIIDGDVAYLIDLSRQDMHMTRENTFSVDYLLTLGLHKEAAYFATQHRKRYRSQKRSDPVTAEINGTQPSGRGDTTLNNSGTVDTMLHALLEPGDLLSKEAIHNLIWNLGFSPKIEVVNWRNNVLSVEFLQQRMYPALVDGVRKIHPGNRLGRVLFRTFWTRDSLKVEKKRGLMRAIALSLYADNRHVPIINDVLKRILQLTIRDKPYEDTDLRADKRRIIDTDPIVNYDLRETPETLGLIAQALSLPVTDLMRMRATIRKLPLFSCWGEEHAEIFRALAKWDL
jgi:hypothetical protein